MGCLRLIFAFLFSFLYSLFFATLLTGIGAILGTYIQMIPLGHSSVSINFDTVRSVGGFVGGGIGALLGLFLMKWVMKWIMERPFYIYMLEKKGTRITARVIDVEIKTGRSSVGKGGDEREFTYYVVVARWVDPKTDQTHIFRSDRRGSYPTYYGHPGSDVTVLFDPQNHMHHFMEM